LAYLHEHRGRDRLFNPGHVGKLSNKLVILVIAGIDHEWHIAAVQLQSDLAAGTILQGCIENGHVGRDHPKPLKRGGTGVEGAFNPIPCILQVIPEVEPNESLILQDEYKRGIVAVHVHEVGRGLIGLNLTLTGKFDR
jgi:hypothetical protein